MLLVCVCGEGGAGGAYVDVWLALKTYAGNNHDFGVYLCLKRAVIGPRLVCVACIPSSRYSHPPTLQFRVTSSASDTLCLLPPGPQVSAAVLALALTHVLQLTGMLQWWVRQTAEVENTMTSVERLLEYTRLPQEPPRWDQLFLLPDPQLFLLLKPPSPTCYLWC